MFYFGLNNQLLAFIFYVKVFKLWNDVAARNILLSYNRTPYIHRMVNSGPESGNWTYVIGAADTYRTVVYYSFCFETDTVRTTASLTIIRMHVHRRMTFPAAGAHLACRSRLWREYHTVCHTVVL